MDSIIDHVESATIRVDTATQKGSVLDVIRMVLACTSGHANTALCRLKNEFSELTAQCGQQLRINGKGKLTPVADAKTLVEIVFLLPGKIARDFRRKSAAKVCRLLAGDSGLISEIEQRRSALQSTLEGRATRAFLLAGSEGSSEVEVYDGMPTGFRFLDDTQRQLVAKEVVELSLERERQVIEQQKQAIENQKQALKRQRVDDLVGRYTSLRDIGVEIDARTKIEIRDNVSLLTKRDLAIEGSSTSTEICVTQDPRTPTHMLGPEQRVHETGIVVVAAKMRVRVPPAMSGPIGKLMNTLYKKKYDLPADWDDFVKRQTLFHGRPILENAHYERDEDSIMEAIRVKLGLSQ